METMTGSEPRAWVGCLGCYNMGRLNGRWMDADDAEEVGGKCDRCFSDEWWCFDVENVLKVREMSPAEFVRDARLAEAIDGHPNADALRVWVADDFHYNVEQRDFDPDDIVTSTLTTSLARSKKRSKASSTLTRTLPMTGRTTFSARLTKPTRFL